MFAHADKSAKTEKCIKIVHESSLNTSPTGIAKPARANRTHVLSEQTDNASPLIGNGNGSSVLICTLPTSASTLGIKLYAQSELF